MGGFNHILSPQDRCTQYTDQKEEEAIGMKVTGLGRSFAYQNLAYEPLANNKIPLISSD
jgi:hypothetical protein